MLKEVDFLNLPALVEKLQLICTLHNKQKSASQFSLKNSIIYCNELL